MSAVLDIIEKIKVLTTTRRSNSSPTTRMHTTIEDILARI